jgi:predicted amidophosphoribosyltransferase
MFAAFKIGEKRFAHPLAAGIAAALQARGEPGFDAIVPIPLSPDKAAAGELDRTRALGGELSNLVQTRLYNYLELTGAISKRRMILQGFTPSQFKRRYGELLKVDPRIINFKRILLIDDAITRGSTLSVAVAAIRSVAPDADIVVSSAVQMVVKDVVADQNGPAW